MPVSEEFKNELRQDNLSLDSVGKALKMALTEAIELKITTWVVSSEGETPATADPLPGYRMQTRINIVDGDIQNEIGSVFVNGGPYAELRDFHLGQVQEGREIIQDNLDNLEKLFSILVGTFKQMKAAPTTVHLDQPAQPNLLPAEVSHDALPSEL